MCVTGESICGAFPEKSQAVGFLSQAVGNLSQAVGIFWEGSAVQAQISSILSEKQNNLTQYWQFR